MSIEKLEAVLNKDNKFYWFLSSIKDTQLNDTVLSLSEALLPTIIEDINKPIIKIENEYDRAYNRFYSVNFSSPAAELFDLKFANDFNWQTDLPIKLLNLYKSAGMDFTQKKLSYTFKIADLEKFENAATIGKSKEVLDEILLSKELKEPILKIDEGYIDQPKYINYIRAVHSQVTPDVFLERIKDTGLLHDAVVRSASDIVNFLLNELNIPVNLKSKDGRIPVTFCQSEETLNIFKNTRLNEIDWLAVDNKGHDALYYFGLLSNKDTSKKLVNSTQEIIRKLVSNDSVSVDVIDESNKKALLGMVNSSKNKKELEDFIRQTKIKDFNGIVDEKGRSMAQIVVSKDEWGKFEMLSKGYDKSHRDARGYSNLEYILVKTNPKYNNKAISVLEKELNNVSTDTGMNMIKRFFRLDKPFFVPKWFIRANNQVEFLKAFLGNEFTKEDSDNFLEVVKTNPMFDRLHSIDPSVVASLKEFARPYFIHALKNGYEDEILNVELKRAFSISINKYSQTKEKSYSISTEMFANLSALRELCIEYSLDVSKLDSKIEKEAIEFIKLAKEDIIIHPNQDSNYEYHIDRFCNEVKMPLSYLIDCGSYKIMEVLDDNFVRAIKAANKYDEIFPKKLEVYMLGQSLISAKSEANEIRTKKMKI